MSFIAPYAFTSAISLYLGYKTYSSYYSNSEFEELDKYETNDDIELNQVAKELVDSIIEKVVKNMEDEQCSVKDEQCSVEDEQCSVEALSKKEFIELPKTRKELEEDIKKDEPKIIEEVMNEDKSTPIKIVITDVDTNNENVLDEVCVEEKVINNQIVKSPIQLPRHHNNLKKRKNKHNKK